MEFRGQGKNISENINAMQTESDLCEMPSSPCLSPMDAPLELYLEMGVFYLEESDT